MDFILTIKDLVDGGVVTKEVAEAVMQLNALEEDAELTENEFIHFFMQLGGVKSAAGSSLDGLMRKKFGKIAANLQKFRTDKKQEEEMRQLSKETASEENGFSLEELVRGKNLMEGFNFNDSFNDDYVLAEEQPSPQGATQIMVPK